MSVIVHIPYVLHENPSTAPQLRPRRMINAFRALGTEVTVVSGTAHDRRRQMKVVLQAIRQGKHKPALVYSESAGWPNAFSEGKKTSFHPLLDASFLRAIRNLGIPVGLYYRDAHYLDPAFYDVPFTKRLWRYVLDWFGKRDRKKYIDYVDRLYFPSIELAHRVVEVDSPTNELPLVDELPPGAIKRSGVSSKHSNDPGLNLLYVGGLGNLYQLHLLVKVVGEMSNVSLTICTRPWSWSASKHTYSHLLRDNVRVVHRADDELDSLFKSADLGVLTVAPGEYWTFAYPVKLFDYIGYGLPIIASKNTLAARYVITNNLGWSVPYNENGLKRALEQLVSEKAVVDQKSREVLAHIPAVSWERRAQKVIDDLVGSA